LTCSPDVETPTSLAWEWQATGTAWRIHHDGCVSAELAAEVGRLVERDEQRWSRFRAASELSRLNARAGAWTPVSPETLELLAESARWQARTGGVFDPLVGSRIVAWGYEESMRIRPPHAQASPAAAALAGRVELDRDAASVRIPGGATLDLGGIAKGWMADRAAGLLRDAVPHGRVLVDAGGDLVAARGTHLVAVEGGPAWLPLREGQSAATSSWRLRRWRNGDGHEAHHLIDPATGAPGARTSATVVGECACDADVLATVLALRPERVDELAEAAQVERDGAVRANAAWAALGGSTTPA